MTLSTLPPATHEAAPPHIACGPSRAVLARSLQSSRPLPAKLISLCISMRRTCSTSVTHVQHMCNTTCNTSTFSVNLQVKLCFLLLQANLRLQMETKKICSERARQGNLTCKFTVKVLMLMLHVVLHVVLHVCCTCVARVLHVHCMGIHRQVNDGWPVVPQGRNFTALAAKSAAFAKQTKAIC